ncbi:synaptonemal complex protein 2-like isoform X2 [Sphaeramia orbicularis]|uniref:synaptonemal complex protein 2-like isoform X2 n=1 Tax=Sphaeramia orbicularis TaxID=375764 RepID=UPI00117BE32F|nr:synaptonemal complex protein 2-like isoform X2 [Sphaeramia orbicularis]
MFQAQVKDCLLREDPQGLVAQILTEGLSSITLTCLDQVVTENLSGSGLSRVQVLLKSLVILSEKTADLLTLIMFWFSTVHDLLTSDLHKNSTVLLDLTESFYDYFLLLTPPLLQVSQVSAVLLHLAEMGLDTQISFRLRLEAFRTFNNILDSLSSDKRKRVQTCQNLNLMLTRVAAAVLTVGGECGVCGLVQHGSGTDVCAAVSDYELQVSLSETLCRLTPKKDRRVRANQWFSSADVGHAFSTIRNGDFEVDCRRFLNFANSYQGDQRVYTFPCLRAFLDSTQVRPSEPNPGHVQLIHSILLQLFCPKDDKWDEFWIDFNLGSECVSFFIDNPQSFLWGSIHLLREEVERYSLNIKHPKCAEMEMVLSVWLNNPIMHQNTTGQKVELIFSSELYRPVEAALGKVFKVKNHSSLSDSSGSVQMCATKSNLRTYKRKKPKKGELKVLPLSSPSSNEEFITKSSDFSRAEFLFDQIKHSTLTFNSGISVEGAGPLSYLSQSGSSPVKDVISGRKRTFPHSGDLLACTVDTPTHRRKEEEPVYEGEESNKALSEACSPDRKETPDRGAESSGIGVQPDSDLMSGIRTVFRTFTEQLEQHFDICRQKVEAEALQSQKQCQQHVSALLTAVNQHRSVQLQMFQNSINYQLEQLQETSTRLNSISENLLSLFQSEEQRVNSIYEELQLRLKSLKDTESGAGHPSSQ